MSRRARPARKVKPTGQPAPAPSPSNTRASLSVALIAILNVSALLGFLGSFAQFISMKLALIAAAIFLCAQVALRLMSSMEAKVVKAVLPTFEVQAGRKAIRFTLTSLMIALLLGGTLGEAIRNNGTQAAGSKPSISYARVFGFYQSLYSLSAFAQKERHGTANWPHYNFFFGIDSAEDEWRKSPLASYAVAREPILSALPSPAERESSMAYDDFVNIVYGEQATKAKVKIARVNEIRDSYVEDIPKSLSDEIDALADWIEPFNQRIGLLMMAIDWRGDLKEIEGAQLGFKVYKIDPGQRVAPDTVQKGLETAEEKFLSLPDPAFVADKVLVPIAFYIRNQEGFEDQYVFTVLKPTRIRYKVNGQMQELVIREPFREKAIKLQLPFGWYGQ